MAGKQHILAHVRMPGQTGLEREQILIVVLWGRQLEDDEVWVPLEGAIAAGGQGRVGRGCSPGLDLGVITPGSMHLQRR